MSSVIIKTIVVTVVVVVVLVILSLVGILDAIFDDESERNDLGGMRAAVELVA